MSTPSTKPHQSIFETLEDDRFGQKRVFMGVRAAEGAVAFDKTTLLTEQVMTDELNGSPIVAVADQRLDTGFVYLNPEEQTVTADGSTVLVGASSYEPDSLPLTSVYTFDAMWFAWHGYYPDTNVYA